MSKKNIYRLIFLHEDTIYEIYAEKVVESSMFGFLEVEGFVFGEISSVLVDPSEERLRLEFEDIKRTYIPTSSIIRIDEVAKKGTFAGGDVKTLDETNKIKKFPPKIYRKPDDSN